MGTSLSGLTPADTFDGLLKVGDNQPLDGTLKAISTGEGTDTILQLSNSALQIGGATTFLNQETIFQNASDLSQTALRIKLKPYSAHDNAATNIESYNDDNRWLTIKRDTTDVLKFSGSRIGVYTTAAASTRFHIKGSGTTSATTSLLVQNSAGTDMLKVQDDGAVDFGALGIEFSNDGSGGTMSVASDRYVKLASSLNTYSALNAHVFKTLGSGSYTEAMRITGNTDQFVGIGETTPTARLHVKGSGNDNTTTSLLVQNSDGTTLFDLRDSGLLMSALNMSNNNVIKFNGQNVLRGSTTANEVTIAEGFNFQNTIIDDSQLTVKGRGTTSATTALLVENSAGTDLFKVNDNGNVLMANNAFQIQTSQVVSYRPGIFGGAGRSASAVLQADSTTQGFLPPRMTTTQRDAITSPASGLMVYNTTTNKAQCYNGTAWQDLF